ncbi:hypothetical protein EB796_018959 [Bugula neritina]|uniref:Uncharacterized protein n=1 Tax=Bugula neritina TaxID=10212 RepID=A0A7J7J922_BUGNE|nr:hypothetical protein EB796_018959 [Bugula neritina]
MMMAQLKYEHSMQIKNSLTKFKKYGEYKWVEGDFLLASYQKNGTHFMWEIMTMLLRGSAEYIRSPKEACMIDLFPLKKTDAVFPSPRVLNTHYRLDVSPKSLEEGKLS